LLIALIQYARLFHTRCYLPFRASGGAAFRAPFNQSEKCFRARLNQPSSPVSTSNHSLLMSVPPGCKYPSQAIFALYHIYDARRRDELSNVTGKRCSCVCSTTSPYDFGGMISSYLIHKTRITQAKHRERSVEHSDNIALCILTCPLPKCRCELNRASGNAMYRTIPYDHGGSLVIVVRRGWSSGRCRPAAGGGEQAVVLSKQKHRWKCGYIYQRLRVVHGAHACVSPP